MISQVRKQYILDTLTRDGQVLAKDIAKELSLSEDTIRRDLRELAKENLILRVHGGALPASTAVSDYRSRQSISMDEKQKIAKFSASLIQNGQVVILDGGTTTVELARHLPKSLRATIITHSPSVAVELVNHPDIDVYLIGGKLFKHSVVTMGTAALESLSQITADVFFMGATGIHHKDGVTTGDLEEAHMKRAISMRAAEVVVMASSEKLDVVSPYRIVPLSDVNTLVVEQALSGPLSQACQNLDIEVQSC